ncbi:MAG: DnaJ C-terminal domain-containing protein [Candidatus Dormibacteria bacterium]
MATTFPDYYATLGVPRNATQKEIKAAFRKLARKHHPDLNQGDSHAEDRFKEINEANEVLSDPEKRRKYDELGPRWREHQQWEAAGRPGAGPFGGFGQSGGGPQVQYRTVSPDELEELFGARAPFSDFFYSMFGDATGAAAQQPRPGRAGRVRSQRGQHVEGDTEITLEEAATGTTRTVELQGPSGTRRVEIAIPAGVADGARVRASGQGSPGSGGGAAGDLLVRVHIRPHPRFTREGDNLRVRVPVPLDVALLGGSVDVPTIRGTTAQLRIPPLTQNRSVLRLRGLGMPQMRGGASGDLLAEIDVRVPATLSDQAAALARRLREERTGVSS